MKKLVLALVFATLATVATAPAALAEIEVEGDAYVGVYDKYLWRGIDLSGGQPVAQGGVDVSAKGFTFSIWSNIDLSGPNSDEATETDFVLDYSTDIGELVSLSVGDIFYTFGPDGGSTHELYLGAALNTVLSPTFTVYYDWDEASTADLDGLFYTLAVGHDVELATGLGLSLGAAINYSQESPFVFNDGVPFDDFSTADLSAGLSYAISEQVSADVSYLYSGVVGSDADDIGLMEDESVAGLNFTLTF